MFLFAEWVKISLDTGGYSLQLQKRQVKPSILYIAKKFGFEMKGANANYATSPFTIFICERYGEKYLLFNDKAYQERFQKLSVSFHGHYKYINPNIDRYSVVDKIWLGHTYYLDSQNVEYAYEKAEEVIKSFKI